MNKGGRKIGDRCIIITRWHGRCYNKIERTLSMNLVLPHIRESAAWQKTYGKYERLSVCCMHRTRIQRYGDPLFIKRVKSPTLGDFKRRTR